MQNLPQEIIADILSRLPVKTLLQFRCVCKSWYALIRHSNFIETHLYRSIKKSTTFTFICTNDFTNLYSINYDVCNGDKEVTKLDISFVGGKFIGCSVVGSCNGLLCVRDWKNTTLVLWNPSTREHTKIPNCTDIHGTPIISFLALGYHPMTKTYKVIGTWKINKHLEVMLYTLGGGSWKSLGNIPWLLNLREPVTLASGTLCWMAYPIEGYHQLVIVSLDVGTEELQEIQLPNNIDIHTYPYLGLWKGELALFQPLLNHSIEVWTMKDHYGVKESWIKQHVFENINETSRFKFLKNGEILLKHNFDGNYLVYDTEKDKATEALINPGLYEVLGFYVSSLVSPPEAKDGIEEQ